ncbi:MAG: ECF transporter S component [Erysipelotrichaceae bacterium]|nr:ECF transporter S component [Erysipelotrichaceae bacterium]
MNNRKKQIRRLVLAAFFVAIEIIMTVTPLGYIPINPALSVTTMHLPVILSGMVLGPSWGAGLGLVFGLTSVIRSTMSPGLGSLFFTPFVAWKGVNGNYWSLLTAIGPRVFLGWFSGMLFRLLNKKMQYGAAAALSAGINTFLHTVNVMGLIWIFQRGIYEQAGGALAKTFPILIGATFASNGVFEIILAVIVIPALVAALKPSMERMGLIEK